MSGGNVLEILPPAARGSFYKNRPWTPQKFFIKLNEMEILDGYIE
jgi:hypothetical protein